MKTALYIRVSTQEQAQEGYSIEAQTDRLQSYCKAKDWMVVGTYTDAGFSGSNTKRPALQRLLDDVRAGLVDCVLVYKLDRLSRSQKDTLMLIEDEFLSRGVAFVSMSENFDTSTPLGRAMIGILSVFAQLEREQIKERMSMGRAERAKNGLWHGGGSAPFGYTYSTEDGVLHIEPIEAEIVREAYNMFLQKTPIHSISMHLSKKYGRVIDRGIVHSILTTPVYKGVIYWGGKIYDGKHEAIVDAGTYAEAQRLMKSRHRIAASKPAPFRPARILSGLLFCANCGAKYSIQGNYSGVGENRYYRPYYVCMSRSKKNKAFVINKNCKNPNYACVKLEAQVIDEVLTLANNQKAFKKASMAKKKKPATSKKNQHVLMRRIDELDTQIRRVLDLYQLGNISMDEIKARVTALEAERDALNKQLEESAPEQPDVISTEKARSLLAAFKDVAHCGEVEPVRDILCELIQRINILDEKGKIDIVWNF